MLFLAVGWVRGPQALGQALLSRFGSGGGDVSPKLEASAGAPGGDRDRAAELGTSGFGFREIWRRTRVAAERAFKCKINSDCSNPARTSRGRRSGFGARRASDPRGFISSRARRGLPQGTGEKIALNYSCDTRSDQARGDVMWYTLCCGGSARPGEGECREAPPHLRGCTQSLKLGSKCGVCARGGGNGDGDPRLVAPLRCQGLVRVRRCPKASHPSDPWG